MSTAKPPPSPPMEPPPARPGLGPEPFALTRLEVRLSTPPAARYPVVVGPAAWSELPATIPRAAHGVAVIADERVWQIWGKELEQQLHGIRHEVYTFPPGDANKSRLTKQELEDAMLRDLWGRDTVILALGGGVATDLGGFVAATYMRGIPYISLPTTLLCMVDASIGGKTGVNASAGKNLVGAFHQPLGVLCNLTTLSTLPAEEWETGIAETLKHGVMADRALVDYLLDWASDPAARDPAVVRELVVRSAAVKIRVVAQDEQDYGLRQILNFGHTIGHALERASGYRLSHGRAVAIGMAVEAAAAVRGGLLRPGVAEEIRAALDALGLPRTLPAGLDVDAIFASLGVDKKVRDGKVRFALPHDIGRAAPFDGQYTTPLPERAVREALEEAAP